MSRSSDKTKTSASFLDKLGLGGGTGKGRKHSALSRPHSEADFADLEDMGPKEVILTDRQVEEQFQQMLDDMNLSEGKGQPLLEQSIEKKRQLLSMRTKTHHPGDRVNTPEHYIRALNRENREHMSVSKITRIVGSLRITLSSNPVSWIKQFGANNGLQLILDVLSDIFSSHDNDLNTISDKYSKMHQECIRCLRAFMNNAYGLDTVFDQHENKVFIMAAKSLNPSRCNVMQEAAKLLAAICIIPNVQGHERVLEAITIASENQNHERFSLIVQGVNQTESDSTRTCCIQLINAIVNMPEDFEFRMSLRNEFMRAGLYDMMDDLMKETISPDLAIQVQVFVKHKDEDYEELAEKFGMIHNELEDSNQCFEIIKHLTTDTPAESLFLAILQHLLCIPDDTLVRSAYFKLIEECISQIVLHRSGYDPDFRAKKFDIDVDGLTNLIVEKLRAADEKRNDEVATKLEEALTHKQEAEAQVEHLRKQLLDLCTVVNNDGVIKKSDFALAKVQIAQTLIPTVPPPPPPPPPPMQGGPPPPPPPPFPGMGGGPPPPPLPGMGGPPPPPMMGGPSPPPFLAPAKLETLPYGMKQKKKWTLDVPMKKTNWKTVSPGKLKENSFWVKVDEENLASPDIIKGLYRFSSKPAPKIMDDQNNALSSNTKSKIKELQVLDSQSAQNLSILLKGSLKHMSYEEVKTYILKCDQQVMTIDILDQLISYLPSPDKLKRLEQLQIAYEDLRDAEQFSLTVSTVKRLTPRLRSMKFKSQYQDLIQDIKPDIVAATAACEEIKSSKKLAKILELVLLMGNVLNSGSRNGQAVGFEIAYLPKLLNTKDIDNRQTLLHYLVEQVETKFPDLLNFSDELIHLDKAARVSVETIAKSLHLMEVDIKNLETDLKHSHVLQGPDDKFQEVMSSFAVECRQQCTILTQMFSKIDTLYCDLADFFVFDKIKYPVEDFLGDIKTFKDQFAQANKDNVKERENEEKIRRAKEAKIKQEQEKQERMARKKALVDMNARDGDNTGVMDNLLEALATGQAFQKRKRPPRERGGDQRPALNRSRSRSNIMVMVLSPSSNTREIENCDPKPVKNHTGNWN